MNALINEILTEVEQSVKDAQIVVEKACLL